MRALVLIIAALAVPVLRAGEHAVLTTGFVLHTERHSTSGETTTLYDRDGGYRTVPSALISRFEAEDPVAAPTVPPPQLPPSATGLSTLVEKAAGQHRVSPALVHSVIAAESAYNSAAVSPKGALGLMQLMPTTARELQVANPMDAAQNINGGTAYLRQLLDRYAGFSNQFERAVAAYNAGPARVDQYGGLPPYRETVDFVARVSARTASMASTAACLDSLLNPPTAASTSRGASRSSSSSVLPCSNSVRAEPAAIEAVQPRVR